MMDKARSHLTIRGVVQGVGFRPFVYRLATELGLTGWVNNSSEGVFVEIEGNLEQINRFIERLPSEKPLRSQIDHMTSQTLAPIGYDRFTIRPSVAGEKTAIVLPDLATCPDCLAEILDPSNRRYRYPFTNCTHCGPRFSIIDALPYDRIHTTMRGFEMCANCQQEYENPLNRRFHAQPNACPVCGPQLELWDGSGKILAKGDATGTLRDRVLSLTVEAIRAGQIVAIKGIGGFHLVVDAQNTRAIRQLRQRKHRPDKPFALMYPSLEAIAHHCDLTPIHETLLLSPEAPIVLLKRKVKNDNFDLIAPNNPYLGVMLPYSPLNHLLLRELDTAIIATSGNLSDEPICIDEKEALRRLKGIADVFLVHNRPITHPIDDSVVTVIDGRRMILRRARGYAPLPITLKEPLTSNQLRKSIILAVGGHLKNTVALYRSPHVFISQHIGDLATPQAFTAFESITDRLQAFYDARPQFIACDAHPDYLSTQFAQSQSLPVISVQHHYAHVLSCMAEHQLTAPVLGIAWDGTGYGDDGTIWGGEFLLINDYSYERVAYFRPFPLPGGEKAIKEPRRSALGLLYEAWGAGSQLEPSPVWQSFSPQEQLILHSMLTKSLNCPSTSSVGRLFDGVASLLDLSQRVSFEGQAAIAIEHTIGDLKTDESYPFKLIQSKPSQPIIIDWTPMIEALIQDTSVSLNHRAARFHNTLVEIIVEIATVIAVPSIVLTGGCFQNHYLLERAIYRLRQSGFVPYWHQQVPPNDGGIALGQILAALRQQ